MLQANYLNYKIYSFEILDSTQAEAKRQIDNNISNEYLVIKADLQTAGKGRNSKEWHSDIIGNLYFSLIINYNNKIQNLYPLIAGCSLLNITKNKGLNSKIKWPNDIYIDNCKLSGILCELYKNKVIIGVGVNIVSSPNLIEKQTTFLNKYIANISTEDFLKDFLKDFKNNIEITENNGFGELMSIINQNLYLKDEVCSINYCGEIKIGCIKNIDIFGNLEIINQTGLSEKLIVGEII